MRLLFLIPFILTFHYSISQELSIDEVPGVWTVIDAGITAYALCGTHDSSKSIGARFEFVDSGQLKIYEKGNSGQASVTLQWKFTTEGAMTVKSKNGEIDLGKVKFYFSNKKLYLDNNINGFTLEKK